MDLSPLQIIRFNEAEHGDFLEPLTHLLHQSYRHLFELGLHYVATHQQSEITLKRLRSGEGYLALWEGQLIGTILLIPSNSNSPCEYYRHPGIYHFGQYAVRLDYQGPGFGRQLLQFVEERAKALGAVEMALDTAEPAKDLIAMYERHGYRLVGHVKWDSTNYRSVVMAKRLV